MCQHTFRQEVSYLSKCFVSKSHLVCFHSDHALAPISWMHWSSGIYLEWKPKLGPWISSRWLITYVMPNLLQFASKLHTDAHWERQLLFTGQHFWFFCPAIFISLNKISLRQFFMWKQKVKLQRSWAVSNHYLELKIIWKGTFWSFFQNQVKDTLFMNLYVRFWAGVACQKESGKDEFYNPELWPFEWAVRDTQKTHILMLFNFSPDRKSVV